MITEIIQTILTVVREETRRLIPTFRWATVQSTAPLRVRFDEATTPLPVTPSTIVSALQPGDRVLALIWNARVTVLGRAGGVPDTGWVPFAPSPACQVHAGQQPMYRVRDGVLYMRGAVSLKSGEFGTGYIAVSESLSVLAGVSNLDWKTSVNLAGAGARLPLRGYVHASTQEIMVAAVSNTVLTPSTYTTLNGFSGMDLTD
jgi:hypothetical protein